MRNLKRVDWAGAGALLASAMCTGTGYVVALVLLFGPVAHAVVGIN